MTEGTSSEPTGAGVKTGMARAGWKEAVLLVLCVSIPCCLAYAFRQASQGQIQGVDFGELYYGARSALHHQDPYDPNRVFGEFRADGGTLPPDAATATLDRIVVTRVVNLPTALFLTTPLALLPWGLAQDAWMLLTAGLLVMAAFLTWDLGAGAVPLMWAGLAGFMLAKSDLVLGNIAGVTVGLCAIAVWCFLKERYVWAGVVLLALSLVLKPHDAGFVWLYFLLAGGVLRKRALQTLAVTAALALCAAWWMASVSPHWVQELHNNLAFVSARGGTSDPGPHGMSTLVANNIISLQAVFSVFKDDPHFYNPASYLISGILILVWGVTVWRRRFSMEGARLALAAIAALTILPVYHRAYDAKLILLALPACAMLWSRPGAKRWWALGLTAAGALLTSRTPQALLNAHAQAIATVMSWLPGRPPAVFVLRPTPFVFLAIGCFYLWVFVRYAPEVDSADTENASDAPIAAQAT